jgi:hypothetical protein
MKRCFAWLLSYPERNAGWDTAAELGRRTFCWELTAVISLLCYLLYLITVVPSLTVAAEAAWGGWYDGGGWRGGAATTPYYGCHGYGYPFIGLTGGYGYVPNHGCGYGYPYAHCPFVRHHFYAAVRGVRRVRDYRSAATTRAPSPPSKTVQAAPAESASPRNLWSPMTVPISPSPATPNTDVHLTLKELKQTKPDALNARASEATVHGRTTEEAGEDASEWAKKFELKLNQLSPDMSAASAFLDQEGFRVDSGNKSATGWFLTAHDSNQRRGSIKLQSDGTKIVLTVTEQQQY